MSFGGGKETFTLEYTIKVVNQSGAGGFSQVNQGMQSLDTNIKKVTVSQEQLTTAQNKVQQAGLGVSKAAKGLTFGLLGMTTAGAEAVGMLSMWQQTQIGVKQAQEDLNQAVQDFGKGSSQAKQATMELGKANRWASMTQRNLMLSMFDMLPFIVLTINGMLKLKTALMERAKAAKELATINSVLSRSELGVAASSKAVGGSMLLQANGMAAATKGAGGFRVALASISTAATGLLIKLAPLLAILAAIGVGVVLYANNIGGLKKVFDDVGIAIGNAIPQLKGFLTTISEVAQKLGKGDIQGAIDVIMQKVTGETALEQISKKDEKAMKDLEELYTRVRESALQFFSDLAFMDKKERKEELFNLGIKGGAGKRFKGVLDQYKKFSDGLNDFANAVKTAQVAETLKKYGMDIPDSMFKKIEFTWEDRFRKLSTIFGGKNSPIGTLGGPFSALADALEKDAKKNGGKNMAEIVMKFMKGPDGAAMLEAAKALGFTEFVEFATYEIDQEEKKLMERLRKAKWNNWWKEVSFPTTKAQHVDFSQKEKDQLSPEFMSQFPGVFGKTVQLPDAKQNVILDIKDVNGNSMVSVKGGDVNNFITGVLKTMFSPGEWYRALQNLSSGTFWEGLSTEINNFFYTHLLTNTQANDVMNAKSPGEGNIKAVTSILMNTGLFSPASWFNGLNAMGSGDFFNGVNLQIFTFFSENLLTNQQSNNVLNTKSPLESNIVGIQALLQNSGLFDLSNWDSALKVVAAPVFWSDLTIQINTFIQSNLNRLDSTKNQPGSGGVDVGQGEGFSNWIKTISGYLGPLFDIENWKSAANSLLKTSPWINKFLNADIIGGLKDLLSSMNITTTKTVTTVADTSLDIEKELDKYIWNPINKAWTNYTNRLKSNETIKAIHGALNWAGAGLKSFIDELFHGPAEGSTGSDTPGTDANVIPMTVVIDKVDVSKITSDSNTAASGVIQIFQDMVQKITNKFTEVANLWSVIMNSLGSNAASGNEQVQSEFSSMWEFSTQVFNDMANVWSEDVNLMIRLAADASNDIQSEFDSMGKAIWKSFVKLANNWQKALQNMVNNAQKAANKINSIMDGIKDTESTHTIHVVRTGSVAKGGLMSFAEGGVMSAAGGKLLTTYGPQMFQIGDNPGGRESIWAIPHNNPGPTVAKIDRMYKPGSNGSNGVTVLNGNFNFVIPAEGIINNVKLNKRIKMTVGENRDRFGF